MADQDSVQEMQAALGWAPTPGPEEQAAYARLGGEFVTDDVSAPPAPTLTPAPVVPTPVPAPAPTTPPPPTLGDIPGAPVAPSPQDTAKQDAALTAQANKDAAGYKAQLVTAGWDDNAAHQAATQYARAQYNEGKNKALNESAELQAQNNAALHYGKEYNVDPALLTHYPSPAAMEAAAKHLKAQGERLTKLEGSPTPKTPAQNFDSQNGGGMTNQQRKIAYATGQINLTGEEYRTLYNR